MNIFAHVIEESVKIIKNMGVLNKTRGKKVKPANAPNVNVTRGKPCKKPCIPPQICNPATGRCASEKTVKSGKRGGFLNRRRTMRKHRRR